MKKETVEQQVVVGSIGPNGVTSGEIVDTEIHDSELDVLVVRHVKACREYLNSLRGTLLVAINTLIEAHADYVKADLEVQELGVIRSDSDPELARYIRNRNSAHRAMRKAVEKIKYVFSLAVYAEFVSNKADK